MVFYVQSTGMVISGQMYLYEKTQNLNLNTEICVFWKESEVKKKKEKEKDKTFL